MTSKVKDNAGVVAPPPLIFLSGLIFGGIIQMIFPLYIFPASYVMFSRIAGILLAVFAIGIIVSAQRKMKGAKTNIEPWKPTNSIISDGVYSHSRNPVYVAMVSIYLGITLIFNAFWFLPFLIVILIIITFGVILREEKYLEKKFGDQYLNYKESVRRWI